MTDKRAFPLRYRWIMVGAVAIVPAAILLVAGCEPDPSRQAERLISKTASPRVVRVKSVKWCAPGTDGERVGRFQAKLGDAGHGVVDRSYLVRFRGGNAVEAVSLDDADGHLAGESCA